MSQWTLVSAILVFAGVSCNKGYPAAPGAGVHCGDRRIEGRLVPALLCPSQSASSLPDYRSEQGLRCILDVYLSTGAISDDPAVLCSTAPFTSQCFLQRFGLDEPRLAKKPSVSMVGTMKSVSVCAPRPDCNSKTAPGCVVCKQQQVFFPCAVSQ